MPTLAERIDSIQESAHQLGEGQARRARFEKFATRSNQLHTETEKLQRNVATLKVLRAAKLAVAVPRVSKELRNKPFAVLQAFTADPNSFIDDVQFGVTLKVPLETFNDRLDEALTQTWQSHVASIVPEINAGTLRLLHGIGFATQVERLNAVLAQMQIIQRRAPESGDLEHLIQLKQQADAAWAELADVPPAVQAFLSKASTRQAAFADLTEEIRLWLEIKGVISHLRISLA